MIIAISSLYANPIGLHHIKYLQATKELAGKNGLHVAIINSDAQVSIKESCPFQEEQERLEIVKALECVDQTILAIDKDGSIAETLIDIVTKYDTVYGIFNSFLGGPKAEFIFAKGGDRSPDKNPLPEKELFACERYGIQIVYGVGGSEKTGASSTSLSRAFQWYLTKRGLNEN